MGDGNSLLEVRVRPFGMHIELENRNTGAAFTAEVDVSFCGPAVVVQIHPSRLLDEEEKRKLDECIRKGLMECGIGTGGYQEFADKGALDKALMRGLGGGQG